MGNSTQTTTSKSQTTPYAPAKAGVDSLLSNLTAQIPAAGMTGVENNALDALAANAASGNPYAGQIGDLASRLLSGGGAMDQAGNVSSGLADYNRRLGGIADGDMLRADGNPLLRGYLDTIGNDVSNRVNGMFAAAGRDMSGANLGTLARGISEGTAPILANQYNTDVQNMMNAAGSLYGAGNTTAGLLSGLNQQDLANRQAGGEASTVAQQAKDSAAQRALQVEQMRRDIPTSNYANLLGTIAPVAQAFGTTDATQKTTGGQSTASQILGGVLGGAGLLGKLGAFGSGGWLLGSGSGAAGLLPLLFSDRRLKEDVEKVGKLNDGSNVYSYRYKGDDTTHIGLMADEVEKRTPKAVHNIGGVKMVDYKQATRPSAKRS